MAAGGYEGYVAEGLDLGPTFDPEDGTNHRYVYAVPEADWQVSRLAGCLVISVGQLLAHVMAMLSRLKHVAWLRPIGRSVSQIGRQSGAQHGTYERVRLMEFPCLTRHFLPFRDTGTRTASTRAYPLIHMLTVHFTQLNTTFCRSCPPWTTMGMSTRTPSTASWPSTTASPATGAFDRV